jgi:hypothetical protein
LPILSALDEVERTAAALRTMDRCRAFGRAHGSAHVQGGVFHAPAGSALCAAQDGGKGAALRR